MHNKHKRVLKQGEDGRPRQRPFVAVVPALVVRGAVLGAAVVDTGEFCETKG